MMPSFFKMMPKPKKGKWESSVWRTTIRGEREVWTKEVNGLLRAYIVVRFRALYEDIMTPSYGGELGIDWKIRKVE